MNVKEQLMDDVEGWDEQTICAALEIQKQQRSSRMRLGRFEWMHGQGPLLAINYVTGLQEAPWDIGLDKIGWWSNAGGSLSAQRCMVPECVVEWIIEDEEERDRLWVQAGCEWHHYKERGRFVAKKMRFFRFCDIAPRLRSTQVPI